jgi:hypothetical protein
MQKSMIRYFPSIYTDELFFSWIARFLEQMKFPIRGNVIRDLFGYTSYKAVIDFPSHLEHLVHQLSIECTHLSVDELIDWHTLLPLFAPFLPSERLKKLRKDMQGNNGLAARLRSGIMASRIPLLRELQICSKCTNSDRNKYGETYWHRSHQIPGVKVCYEHKIPLAKLKNDFYEDKFVTAEHCLKQSKWSDVPILKCETHELITIAEDVHWLLEHPEIEAGADFVYKQYKDLLAEKGFMKKYGRKVFTNKLKKAFYEYYPSKVLTKLNCDLDDYVEKNWLVRLVQMPRNATQHPLYHLLLMRFLGKSPAEFFKEKSKLGTKEKYLLDQAKYLDLDNRIRYSPNNKNITEVKIFRSKWMKCIAQAHTSSIIKLQKKGMKIYRWLLRHDKAWLLIHPRRQRKYFVQRGIVDWHKRDLQLSKKIIETVARKLSSSRLNKRLTPTEIFTQMGESRSKLASMREGKLPITRRVLLKVTSSSITDI